MKRIRLVMVILLGTHSALVQSMQLTPLALQEGVMITLPWTSVPDVQYRRCNDILKIENYYLYRSYELDDFVVVFIKRMAGEYGGATAPIMTWEYTTDGKNGGVDMSCRFFDMPAPSKTGGLQRAQKQVCRNEKKTMQWQFKQSKRRK